MGVSAVISGVRALVTKSQDDSENAARDTTTRPATAAVRASESSAKSAVRGTKSTERKADTAVRTAGTLLLSHSIHPRYSAGRSPDFRKRAEISERHRPARIDADGTDRGLPYLLCGVAICCTANQQSAVFFRKPFVFVFRCHFPLLYDQAPSAQADHRSRLRLLILRHSRY